MKSIIPFLLFVACFGTYTHTYAQKTPKKDKNVVFTIVENMPEFPGGDEGMAQYLRENIVYPQDAKKLGIEGKVYVTFVVDTDGTITQVKILRGIGGGCDQEAVRVVKNMPRWKPGTQGGKAVRVQFNMAVAFKP